jgi:release factor glutamine methyltransferase
VKTVLETIRSGTPYLEKAGVENARLNMEHLLAKVLGCRRMQLYLDFDRPLSEEQLIPLRDLVKRRAKREPLQHLLGNVEFAGREFRCDARALIPRPETDHLYELVSALYKTPETPPPTHIIDMGTGSGVLGLSLALAWTEAITTLVDVSDDALALARENAVAHGLAEPRVHFIHSDLWTSVPPGAPFDLVVANLPYIPEADRASLSPEVHHDPPLALYGGPVGSELIERFLREALPRLAKGARLALEVGLGQTASLATFMEGLGLREVTIIADYSHRDRFLMASAP